MDDYISRSNAIRAFVFGLQKDEVFPVDPQEGLDAVRIIPAADVVEVVRCKDCKHYDCSDHLCELYDNKHFERFFCHDGERKNEDG